MIEAAGSIPYISDYRKRLSSQIFDNRNCAAFCFAESAFMNEKSSPKYDISWIRAGLDKPGKSKSGLAKALGRAPSMVTTMLKGDREIKAKEIAIIERYLEVDAPPSTPIPSPYDEASPTLQALQVIGEVAAGVWLDANAEAFERYVVDVPRDDRFSPEDQFLLKVRGNSINRKAVSGSLVRCLNVFAAPRKPETGDWVVARRTRNDSVETTVKRLEIASSEEHLLWPESTDPAFQNPIRLGAHDGDDYIEITAFVIDFINPATRF